MSSPNTSSKASIKVSHTAIHSTTHQNAHQPTHPTAYPDEKPQIHSTTHPPAHQPTHATGYSDEKTEVHSDTIEYTQVPQTTTATPLQVFQSALGIPPPKKEAGALTRCWKPKPKKGAEDPTPAPPPNLTPRNKGVYEHVISCERTARWKYYLCDSTITIAMFLQIVVGASVTAFGAGQSSHILITVFGAANTALASLLAVLKSQGLPNRMRQDWVGWRDLREYIELNEREIEMSISGRVPGVEPPRKQDVWQKVKTIEEKYRVVRLTCEANRPGDYTKLDSAMASK